MYLFEANTIITYTHLYTFGILFSCSSSITKKNKTGKRALKELYWPSTQTQPSMSKPSRQATDLHRPLCRTRYTLGMADKKKKKKICHTVVPVHEYIQHLCWVLVPALVCNTGGNFGVLTNVPRDWNSQSDISLHYRLVSPCLEGANWNRWRQLLLAASLMAANERRLCAVDPYAEQEHVVAQSDGENSSIYGVSPTSVTSQRHPHQYWLNVAQKQNLISVFGQALVLLMGNH